MRTGQSQKSKYREEKSSGRMICLGFGRCKIHGDGAAKKQEQQMLHFRKLLLAAKAKAAPASPLSQIPRFLINSNCGGSSCTALTRDWLREEPLSRALTGRLHKNEISTKAPGQTGHFWVTGALAWIFSSSACSQRDEMQSSAPFLCFLQKLLLWCGQK